VVQYLLEVLVVQYLLEVLVDQWVLYLPEVLVGQLALVQ
jgi:hypothetical protein